MNAMLATAEAKPGRLIRGLHALDTLITCLLPWRWVMWIFRFLFNSMRGPGKTTPLSDTTSQTQASSKPESESESEPEAAHRIWPESRLALVERMWGEGCILPSARDFLHTYLPLLALSEKKSMALLGAGPGGIGYKMTDESGVWVSAFEANEELAAIGAERSVLKAMKKKAGVRFADFESFEIKPKSLDAAVSLETLYTVQNKETLLRTLCDGLRVDGELFYIDYVLPGTDPPNAAVTDWYKSELQTPHLWTAAKTQSFLASLGLDMRPPQDITRNYRNYVISGWLALLANITKAELLDMADDVFAECEFWSRKMAAFESGGLRVYKFNAFQPPGAKPERAIEVGTGSDDGPPSLAARRA